jgi:lipoprotein-releasing system permease protein
MPSFASNVWDLATALGGTAALAFIVAIALGINALTVLFLGSAVVVLERFARAMRRWRSVALVGLGLALLAGGLAAQVQTPHLMEQRGIGGIASWAGSAAVAALIVAVTAPLVYLALRRLAPLTLGRVTLATLGLGYGLLVGGLGHVGWAAAPPLAAALAALAIALRRRRRGGAPAGEGESLLRTLAASLVIGIPVAVLLPAPEPRVSAGGAGVLSVVVTLVVFGLLPLAGAGLLDVRKSVEWFIAARYLVAKRRQTFISVITLICVGGVAVGVWLIITVLSVMNGFERTWRDEIIGNRAHFTVHSGLGSFGDYAAKLDQVREVDGVIGVAPYLDAEGMVRGRSGEIVGIRVRGIDPALVGSVTELPKEIVAGDLNDLGVRDPASEDVDGLPGILIGSELAAGLALGIGDRVVLVSPFGGPPTPFGPAPRLKPFRVAGIFRSSFFQWDEVFTYTSLAAAQDFRRAEGDVVDGIEVRVEDFYRSQRIGESVQERLGFPYFVRDWKEYFPSFFQALKTERVMMFFLLTMIMVVAAFVIVATLIMMIMEKTSDIAILKTMGARDETIERIFAIEGTLIGLAGTLVGVAAGIVVTTQLDWIQRQIENITGIDTLPASVYQFSTLPWEIDPVQIGVVATIAMVLSLGATLLPSRQGARLDPAEALRYE